MSPPRITAAMCASGRTLGEPRLSPDGRRVAMVVTEAGRGRLVVLDADGGPERVVTSDPGPSPARAYGGGSFDWLPDGSGLVFAGAKGGLWHQPGDGGPARSLVAEGRVAAPAVSPDGTRVAYLLDTRHVAVVSLDSSTWPVCLSAEADFCLDPAWSPDSAWVAWHEWDVPAMPWDASRIAVRRADGTGAATVVAGGEGIAVQQPRFSPDGTRLGFLCDRSGWLNLTAVAWSPVGPSGEPSPLLMEEHEHGTAAWGPGQRSFAWSPDGTAVAVARNESGFGSLQVVDVAGGTTTQLGRAVHGGLSWIGDRVAAIRSGARTPTQVVVYDGPSGEGRRTVAHGPVAGFEAADLPEPELVSWPAGDGATIPGRLYRRADGPLGEPPPMICWVHGGPTDQWGVTFNARIAYWVDRGWAVLVPDHRGSTGHGRAFTQAMAGRWGELDTDDVAAGIAAAADRGWADPGRIAIMGGSAGGFTVLNVLASHPRLCAAGVDLFGVADLFDLDETTHRYEAHYLHSIVGPLPEAAGRYRARSPVNRADAITTPLLILQGTDDEVVPPAQSEAIAERLRGLGRVVELHLYEGEGHGWGRPETVTDELERTESFLRRHVLRWATATTTQGGSSP
ncbi:MAG TPA: S9 family peptidase [Acidimicrobiales bacterium]|nr:S9 family peptidase [Acidimicrobiales bacterium]